MAMLKNSVCRATASTVGSYAVYRWVRGIVGLMIDGWVDGDLRFDDARAFAFSQSFCACVCVFVFTSDYIYSC